MPSISMFYGIVIYMYRKDEHDPAHFHAEYAEYSAAFDLDGTIVEGKLPKNKARLVSAWAVIHKDELEANWKLAQKGQTLYQIDPLK